jgi:hypothetical protein
MNSTMQNLSAQPTSLDALKLAMLMDIEQLQDLADMAGVSADGDSYTLALQVIVYGFDLDDAETAELEAWQLMQRLYVKPTHMAALRFAMQLDIEQLQEMATVEDINAGGDKPTLALRLVVEGRQLDYYEVVKLAASQKAMLARKRAASAARN